MPRTVLVCGGRDFNDYDFLVNTLDSLEITELIHGAARGADSLAEQYAKARSIPVQRFPADWSAYGKRAGYIRNSLMLREGKPDLVVAFQGGRGTAHMVRLARDAGLEVMRPQEDPVDIQIEMTGLFPD